MNKKYLYIGAAALLGTSLRAGIGLLTNDWSFPYATLAINIIASYSLVVLYECIRKHNILPDQATTAIGTGLIGSFSTLSAVAYDTAFFIEIGSLETAAINYFANMIICFAAAGLGLATSQIWIQRNRRSVKGSANQ